MTTVHFTNSIADSLSQENPLYFVVGEGDFRGATFAVVDDDDKAPLKDNMVVNVSSTDRNPKAIPPTTTNSPKCENEYEEL